MNLPSSSSRPVAEWKIAAVACLIGIVVVAGSLLRHDGDITGLIKFGAEDEAQEITAHVEDLMGRDIATVPPLGHDGKFFFLQALDPLYLTPDDHAVLLDRPIYRGQRMLFPLLAGAGGLTPVDVLPWTMAAVNLAALALGTIGTARLAQRNGASQWWGLAFALNIGIIFEFDISGAGILAFAAAIWGTLALEEDRPARATGWFTAAVLAREVMFLYLAGVILLRWVRTKRIPWTLGLAPSVAAVAWAVYLRLRLAEDSGVDEVQEFGRPFGGMIRAFPNWVENPIDLVVVGALIALIPLFVVRAVRRPTYLSWGAIGFVLIAILLSRQVWWRFFDITRAIAPIMTAYVIQAFATPDPVVSRDVSESKDAPVDAASTV